MKKILFALCAVLALGVTADAKTLVAYYSRTGNTAVLAEKIANATGADIFKIETVDANHYPADYTQTTKIAQDEIKKDAVVAINTTPDLTEYETIFIGTPVWWGTMSIPVKSFLHENDMNGKTIVPFATHGGGGAGSAFTDITTASNGANSLSGLAVSGGDVQNADDTIKQWLSEIKIQGQE